MAPGAYSLARVVTALPALRQGSWGGGGPPKLLAGCEVGDLDRSDLARGQCLQKLWAM